MLVPELIQEDCNPQRLAAELQPYLGNDATAEVKRQALKQRFSELHKLIQCNADAQAARAVIDLLEE